MYSQTIKFQKNQSEISFDKEDVSPLHFKNMIDRSIFENKTAAYYTLGCKLNFAETSAIGRQLSQAGITKARKGQKERRHKKRRS